MMLHRKYIRQPGFTIVELLIIVVVIAILATITIVSYNNIQKTASASVLQAELRSVSKQLQMYFAEHDAYPTSLVTAGILNAQSAEYQYEFDNTSTPKTFCVTGTSRNLNYKVTQTSIIAEGTCSGFIAPAAAPPTVTTVAQAVSSTDTTSHTINTPGSTVAGNLLLLLFTNDGSASTTPPAGWTVLWSSTAGTALRGAGYVKIATGSDAGTPVTLVTSAAEQSAMQLYVINGWSGLLTNITVGTPNINVDPAPGGTTGLVSNTPILRNKTLLVAVTHTSTSRTVIDIPSAYSNLLTTRSNNDTAAGQLASVYKIGDTSTDTSGQFSFSGTGTNSVTQVVAIQP